MQEKILFPSLDRLSDYLVLTVRAEGVSAPAALTVSGAAKVWLRSEGTGYALYTYDTTGTEVRLVHRHDNLSLLQLFSLVEGALYFNGAALATANSVSQRVRSINGTYPDAAGAVTLSGLVKKVNNISPDSNGNVTIEVTASGAPSVLLVPVPNDPDGDLLHLIVEFASTSTFVSPVRIDTRTGRTGVYVFGSDAYDAFPSTGVGTAYYGSRVLIERPTAAAGMKFARCRWHDGTDYTSWRAL